MRSTRGLALAAAAVIGLGLFSVSGAHATLSLNYEGSQAVTSGSTTLYNYFYDLTGQAGTNFQSGDTLSINPFNGYTGVSAINTDATPAGFSAGSLGSGHVVTGVASEFSITDSAGSPPIVITDLNTNFVSNNSSTPVDFFGFYIQSTVSEAAPNMIRYSYSANGNTTFAGGTGASAGPVPEPAFFQMGGLLGMSCLGGLVRRAKSKGLLLRK